MHKKILKFIKEQQMFEQGDRLVIGVSGGADSVCLLHMLCRIREEYRLELFAVHVNHGLRGEEAGRDERFVVSLCEKMQVPCQVVTFDIREEAKRLRCSEEEAGREMRYRSFLEAARQQGGTKIAVAHHMEDNAETVLFRAFRGTGITGLAGIAPVSTLQADDALRIVRPLLCCTRAEVEAYLEKAGQAYCTDSTNLDSVYSRNRIRNEILPIATQYINQQSVRNLNTLAMHAQRVTEYLERQAEVLYQSCVVKDREGLTVRLYGTEETVLLELVFRRCLYELAGKRRDILTVHIETLMELCQNQVGSRLDLPYGIGAKRVYDGICLFCGTERKEDAGEDMCVSVDLQALREGISVPLPSGKGNLHFSVRNKEEFGTDAYSKIIKIAQNDYTKCFDYDKIKGDIFVRMPEDADWIQIHPEGGKKMLNAYLVDTKVPLEKRKQICLVAEDNMVLWIQGMRTGENRRVSDRTERILLIEWNI